MVEYRAGWQEMNWSVAPCKLVEVELCTRFLAKAELLIGYGR